VVGTAKALGIYRIHVLLSPWAAQMASLCLAAKDQSGFTTFGSGCAWQLGHAEQGIECVPRLVEALVRKKLVSAAPG